MKELVPHDTFGVFVNMKKETIVSSLDVARVFEKDHKNVLRDIENLDCSEDFKELNFELFSYKGKQGKKSPCYYMTRDGFMFLVMGYRGKKAARIKEAYIKRFNSMENFLADLLQAREDFPQLTEAIESTNPSNPWVYKIEFDMINRIVLGMDAKKFKETHGLDKHESIRPHMSEEQIKKIKKLQTIDVGLVYSGMDYAQRKEKLISI